MSAYNGTNGTGGPGGLGGGSNGGAGGVGLGGSGGPPRFREWKIGCKVYIGNLAEGVSKSDLEGAFSKYGQLRNVWVARNPPGFAFVEFEDGRDAEDACRGLDGTRIAGGRIKAEMSHGRSRRGQGNSGGGRGPMGYRGGHPYDGGYSHGPRGGRGYRGGYHGGDHYGSYHGGGRSHPASYGDRPPRDRHTMRPRSPPVKEYSNIYSRSRSTSPVAKAGVIAPKAARPRTPPSRSATPDAR